VKTETPLLTQTAAAEARANLRSVERLHARMDRLLIVLRQLAVDVVDSPVNRLRQCDCRRHWTRGDRCFQCQLDAPPPQGK